MKKKVYWTIGIIVIPGVLGAIGFGLSVLGAIADGATKNQRTFV